MKLFSEFFKKLTKHTKIFLRFSLILLVCLFGISALLKLFSVHWVQYTLLEQYADTLLICMRPICLILFGGALAMQWMETTGENLDK
ncbi:MAG TPA: hypothetical protein DDY98_06595 [Ruminococcaceae bacterium]|nr:hypothetical protein [Oscillospiraceae bacterium]